MTKKDSHQLGLNQGINIGRSQMKREVLEIIEELPIDITKDYKTNKTRILIDKKELKQKIKEKC